MEFEGKNIRLPRCDYLGQRWYFLTMCTQDRAPVLREAALVSALFDLLAGQAQKHFFGIEAYCFMPDHLHVLVSGTRETSDCMAFMYAFKQRSAFAYKKAVGKRLWQQKFYDHILRHSEPWEAVAYYIWMNPVRKSLCVLPQDWPFSGSETVDWKRLMTPPDVLWLPPWKRRTRSGALRGGIGN